jgi:signal transduction histidine kinase/DNA-binding response OmpR family regulator
MKWRENQVQIKLTLLLTIGIIGIFSICLFAHRAFSSLRETVKEFQYPDQKIKHLSSLSDQTNNADQFLRLYTITKKNIYIDKYNKSVDSINQLFETYRKYIEGDTFRIHQIDTIQMWWNKKVLENTEILKLNNDKPDILVIGTLVDKSKDTTLYSTQIYNEKTIHDSLVIIKKILVNNEQRTGLLRKVKRVFEKKEDIDVDVVADSADNLNVQLYSYTYKEQDTIFTDTLVKLESFNKSDKAAVKNVLQEKMEYDTIVNLKRLAIIEKDFIIRNRIAKQIKSIQKQEQEDAVSNIAAIQNISTKTINKIFWIFLFILFTCVCLYLLLVLDTYRIKRYEEKLILEKQNYQNLANNRSQFLSMMAHELRTPLQSIIGFSDLLHEQNKSAADKSFHYSEIIKNSSSHLLQTINLLLDRSKIDAGKLELENIPFNVTECLHSVFESLSLQAQDKKINYLYQSDIPDDLIVISDAFRLKQVLYNLLSNAIKFTSEGTVQLRTSTFLDSEKYTQIRFEISDTGIGIPSNKIDQLFDEYNQLNNSIGRLFGGTGLGLVITKKILGLFSSEITVYSEEKKGTQFSFDILFEKSAQSVQQLNQIHEHIDASVLLIDDDNYNLLYTHQLLSKYAAQVYVAGSIEEAKLILEKESPDIVLCDLYIDQSLGTDIIPFIKPAAKIIFMSADHERLLKIKEANQLTLPKPYSIEILLNTISNLPLQTDKVLSPDPSLDYIHIDSFKEKITLIGQAIEQNDVKMMESVLHQIKTTFGYLQQWEEIKHIQKIENMYLLYKDDAIFQSSVAELYAQWNKFYSN